MDASTFINTTKRMEAAEDRCSIRLSECINQSGRSENRENVTGPKVGWELPNREKNVAVIVATCALAAAHCPALAEPTGHFLRYFGALPN